MLRFHERRECSECLNLDELIFAQIGGSIDGPNGDGVKTQKIPLLIKSFDFIISSGLWQKVFNEEYGKSRNSTEI
ncbi:hypothetical protein DSL72_001332 [Monilinia vaccinii-corymbosi]|uniref:Uncharacterized protein n=1 Tax=Monilinia vaccinii-corymbosi TaxID=61207 RepID=A0A8A3P1Q8_9HELO|nr:hypothetical protein DSL72_001332 [Monilinia vaccinii-corymbosi]